MRLSRLLVTTLFLAATSVTSAWAQAAPATVTAEGSLACKDTQASCDKYDAIVFVHGIYGSDTTFVNGDTHFDWVKSFPRNVDERPVDVYRLTYTTAFARWARGATPDFQSVADAMYVAMKPLRMRQYRSIGFIAHSLGGNFVSTYLVMVTLGLGHPSRSQHAFVITLATPVLGAQIANVEGVLRALGMSDPLLQSLTTDNQYLKMLKDFRERSDPKAQHYGCRAVHLHAAYEKEKLGPILVVTKDSAAEAVSQSVASPVVGFDRNHSSIVKPRDANDEVYTWVLDRVVSEYDRLAIWDRAVARNPNDRRLCDQISPMTESLVAPH
jgi:hypothetical protein